MRADKIVAICILGCIPLMFGPILAMMYREFDTRRDRICAWISIFGLSLLLGFVAMMIWTG